jgi:ribosomal peptide maturation radical SAM protein 1
MQIALISMPWQSPRRPSIQLGALKAFVAVQRPQYEIDPQSYFVDPLEHVTVDEAETFGTGGVWLGEGLFAERLFGHDDARARFLAREAQRVFPGVPDILERGRRVASDLVARIGAHDWSRYEIVGLSVVFGQTFSSLLAARIIRERCGVPIVFGGPAVAGKVGRSVVGAFGFVDAVVHGEGERPLVEICDAIHAGKDWRGGRSLIVADGAAREFAFNEVKRLDDLPVPDYDEYFARLEAIAGPRGADAVEAQLVVETSRGCWWDRSSRDPQSACTFCNLNLQWSKYRERSTAGAAETVGELLERYPVPRLVIVDNILRNAGAIEFLDAIAQRRPGLWISMEARAHVGDEHFAAMARAGVADIQFGIEAMTTDLLSRVNKGTTGLQNVRALKLCTQYGMRSQSNLIVAIPNATQAEIDAQLAVLELVAGYEPLAAAPFCLMHDSPISKAPERFDVRDAGNHPAYRYLLPEELERELFFLERAHVARTGDWQPTLAFLRRWTQTYRARQEAGRPPALRFVPDGDDLYVVDERDETAGSARTLLSATDARVALCANDIRTVADVAAELGVPAETVRSSVASLVTRRLAASEKDRYIALPLLVAAPVRSEVLCAV